MWVIRAVPPGAQPSLSSLGCSRAALINHHTTDGIDFFFRSSTPSFLLFLYASSLSSISAASFLHPSLPYTSSIIALEQCQPPVEPQTAGLSSLSVLLLSPWPHLLNTLLVSGSVESHCGLTKEMWDWFLPLQIKLKFSPRVCARVRVRVRQRGSVRKQEKSREDVSGNHF